VTTAELSLVRRIHRVFAGDYDKRLPQVRAIFSGARVHVIGDAGLLHCSVGDQTDAICIRCPQRLGLPRLSASALRELRGGAHQQSCRRPVALAENVSALFADAHLLAEKLCAAPVIARDIIEIAKELS